MPCCKTGSLRWAAEEAISNMQAGKVAWMEGSVARTPGELFIPVVRQKTQLDRAGGTAQG